MRCWCKERFVGCRRGRGLTSPWQSPLHVSSGNGDVDLVKLLLKKGADLSRTDDKGFTPLHSACKAGHLEVVSTLLEARSDVCQRTAEGNTPFHLLVSVTPPKDISPFFQTLEAMKTAGADLDERNDFGETPLHCACSLNMEKTALWLIRQGVDVNLGDTQGDTALHNAAAQGSESLVTLLIRAGASLTRSGANGTARYVAEMAERAEIVYLIDDLSKEVPAERQTPCIVINGKKIDSQQLEEYRELYKAACSQIGTKIKSLSVTKSSKANQVINEISEQAATYSFIIKILRINQQLLEPQDLTEILWSGFLWDDKGARLWYRVESNSLVGYAEPLQTPDSTAQPVTTIELQGNVSFRAYAKQPQMVTLIRVGSFSLKTEEHYSIDTSFESDSRYFLRTLVRVSGSPVEFIDSKQLISMINRLASERKLHSPRAENGSPMSEASHIRAKRSSSTSSVRIRSSTSSIRSAFQKNVSTTIASPPRLGSTLKTHSASKDLRKSVQPATADPEQSRYGAITDDGTILSTNFSSFFYSETFPSIQMTEVDSNEKHSYILTSGCLRSTMQYLLLHCHPALFGRFL